MIIKANYIGFFPLGSDIEINQIKIMQQQWICVMTFSLTIGKGNNCSAFGEYIFKVICEDKSVFFSAVEHGLGHYHIFIFNEKANRHLTKCKMELPHEEKQIISEFYNTYPKKLFYKSRDLDYKLNDYLMGYTSQLKKRYTKGIKLAYKEKGIFIEEELKTSYLDIMNTLTDDDLKTARKYYELMQQVVPILNKYIVR